MNIEVGDLIEIYHEDGCCYSIVTEVDDETIHRGEAFPKNGPMWINKTLGYAKKEYSNLDTWPYTLIRKAKDITEQDKRKYLK